MRAAEAWGAKFFQTPHLQTLFQTCRVQLQVTSREEVYPLCAPQDLDVSNCWCSPLKVVCLSWRFRQSGVNLYDLSYLFYLANIYGWEDWNILMLQEPYNNPTFSSRPSVVRHVQDTGLMSCVYPFVPSSNAARGKVELTSDLHCDSQKTGQRRAELNRNLQEQPCGQSAYINNSTFVCAVYYENMWKASTHKMKRSDGNWRK